VFINLLTEESYVGSSTNLSVRFRQYYNYNYISSATRGKSVIYLSILRNGYSNFSLTILEYCEIKDCINREQFYIDVLKPSMNILQMAGSSLGFKHSEKTKALISLANSGINHPLYGKKHLAETLAKMSESHKGKTISAETKALLSKALSGDNHPRYGKVHSAETVAKISAARGGGIIFVYDSKGSLHNTFTSAREAGIYFNCTHSTILKYCINGLMFKGQWILSTS